MAEDKVIDITQRRRDQVAVEHYARLWNLVQQHHDALMRDPMPFIRKAMRMVVAYEHRLEAVRRAVSPPIDVFGKMDNSSPLPNPLAETLHQLAEVRRLVWAPIDDDNSSKG